MLMRLGRQFSLPKNPQPVVDQIEALFETFIGDGAYDVEPMLEAIFAKRPDAMVIVPPHKTAVCSTAGATQRDEHIRTLAAYGRIAWQKKNGYGLRSYADLGIQRYKRIFGGAMKARALPRQKTEAWVSASALNTMTHLGMPVCAKI